MRPRSHGLSGLGCFWQPLLTNGPCGSLLCVHYPWNTNAASPTRLGENASQRCCGSSLIHGVISDHATSMALASAISWDGDWADGQAWEHGNSIAEQEMLKHDWQSERKQGWQLRMIFIFNLFHINWSSDFYHCVCWNRIQRQLVR